MEQFGGKSYTGKWDIYIMKVLKQVYPDKGLNALSKRILCDLLCFVSDNLCKVAVLLTKHSGRVTISSKEMRAATRLVLPGELAKHANSNGSQAVVRFTSGLDAPPNVRADLVFSISRAKDDLKNHENSLWVGLTTPVYLAAVLEYLCAELVELSGRIARDNQRIRIKAHDILLAIKRDEELNNLFRNVVIEEGGVVPHIHNKLLGGNNTHIQYVLKDPEINNISKNAIQRLGYRAGVKFFSGLVYEEMRGVLQSYLEKLLEGVIIVTLNNGRKTMMKKDLNAAIDMRASHNYSEFNKIVGGRFRPGTVALRNIRKYQKTTNLLLPKLTFQRLVREIVTATSSGRALEYKGEKIRYEEDFFIALQTLCENYLIELFKDANLVAINSDRLTVSPKDINLVRRIKGERA